MSTEWVIVIAYVVIALALFLTLIDTDQKYDRFRDLVLDTIISAMVSLTWMFWVLVIVWIFMVMTMAEFKKFVVKK